jgi:hypothetical protein
MRPLGAAIFSSRVTGTTPTAIFLTVLGQSNAIAAGTAGLSPPGGFSGTPTDTQIWVPGTSTFAAYVAGSNSDPKAEVGNAWGQEVAFVQQVRSSGDNRPIFIHKWASGGQALNVGWLPGSGVTWNAWNTQRTAVRTALDALHPNRVEVVLWNQGEADARTTNSPSYEANFDNFVSTLRARDADGAGAIIVVQRIRPYSGDLTNFPYNNCYQVRIAQEKARAGVRVIDQDFEPAGFGSLHPGVSWVIEGGIRCYNAWAANSVINDSAPSNLAGLTDFTGATLGALVSSNEILIDGMDRSAAITVVDGDYRVRNQDNTEWQPWTSSPGTINPFQKLTLRRTASGSPSTTVTMTVTIGGVSEAWTVTTASATLTISGTPTTPVNVGASYSFTPTVAGGTPAYTFSIFAGSLPPGVSLNTSTGALTGTTTTAGSYTGITLRVTDSLSATADLGPFSIVVNAVSSLVIFDSAVNIGTPAQMAYTNSDRTVSTTASTTVQRGARAPAASGKTTGKWYYLVESSGDTLGGSRSSGLCLLVVGPGTGTLGTNRWSWAGTSISSNSSARTMPFNLTTNNGQIEWTADLDANLIWARRAGVGANWNNDPLADPTTGVGGLSISGRGSAAVFPFVVVPGTTNLSSWTFVSGTPPSGFTQWS